MVRAAPWQHWRRALLARSGSLRESLDVLVDFVVAAAQNVDVGRKLEAAAAARAELIAREEADALGRYGPAPVKPVAAIHAVLRGAPDDTIVVDESVSNSGSLRLYHLIARDTFKARRSAALAEWQFLAS